LHRKAHRRAAVHCFYLNPNTIATIAIIIIIVITLIIITSYATFQ